MTTPPDEIDIASVSEAEPIFPASGITILPPVVIRPPPVYVPAPVTFAPLKVRAVVVPDFIIRLPEVFVALPKVVPASLKNISAPSASSIISPLESNVISVPSFVIVSRAMLPIFVISASLISKLPVTSKLPPIEALPVTVKLSATVVSEVVWPIVTAIPLVSVATFKAPTALVIYELDPSWYRVRSWLSPILTGVESVSNKESADSSHSI